MKRKVSSLLGLILIGGLILSCTKTETSTNSSLKQAISESTQNLNTAMNKIASSEAFKVLTVNSESTLSSGMSKSSASTDSVYKTYILLENIKGVYIYKPVTTRNSWGNPLIRFFEKTEDNSKMIVKLPQEKVIHPRSLRNYRPSDSTLTNNFTIAVSDYHNNYNSYHDFDYALASEIDLNDSKIGDLGINYFVSPTLGVKYDSQFSFSESYTAKYKYVSGDTTVSSFTILDGTTVLYEEKLLTIKNDTARFGREHQYTLTIGNVQIVRKPANEIAVYLNGVLQSNATVTIIDRDDDAEASVCKKRDIQITFDDGTTALVSELINNSVDNIKTLFDSLHSVYFAAYIVDWIAYDIYYQR